MTIVKSLVKIKFMDIGEKLEVAGRVLKKLLPFLAIFLISMGLALLLAEKMIRYANPQFTYTQAKNVSLRAYGKSDILPLTLLPNTEAVHVGNTHEFSYTIKTNSMGYRMEEFPVQKPADEYRILMVGDSLTFGFGVEENQSFASLTKQRLNEYLKKNNISDKKVQIINAGFVDGKSPDSYYLYLKELGLKLNPDLIIVNYFINNDVMDLDDTVWEKTDANGLPTKIVSRTSYIDPPFYRLKRPYQNWKLIPPVIRESHLWILFATAWETKSPKTVETIKKILGVEPLPLIEASVNDDCIFRQKCTEYMNELLGKFNKSVDGLVDVAKGANVPLLVSLIPANPQVREYGKIVDAQSQPYGLTVDQIRSKLTEAQPQKGWTEKFNSMGVAVIDPLAYMTDSGFEQFYFKDDGHPNVRGNEILANAFFDFLTGDFGILGKIKE